MQVEIIFWNHVNHLCACLLSHVLFSAVFLCHSCSNRVEAWTRDVRFLLRQEGRPVTQLVGNMSTVRIMSKDWENTDKAAQWIHQRAQSSDQPFALYLGLNLPHPYKTESLGPAAGGSTFRTSPYWLEKACFLFALVLTDESAYSIQDIANTFLLYTQVSSELVTVPKWLPMAAMHPVDYYSTFTKNCSDFFTEEEVKRIRAFYYAMCAEADAMLGKSIAVKSGEGEESRPAGGSGFETQKHCSD